jgi:N-glycosylase/DNA lyase
VKNIKGIGLKEASHFIRNIGFDYENQLAILDRHILKNLKEFGVINEIPKTLTSKKYLEIENRMKKFAERIDISLYELDLLLWSKETGIIFK